MVISWKLHWAVIGAVVSAAVAALTAVYSVSLLITIPGVVAAAALFVAAANKVVHGSPMFRQVARTSREQIARWIALAAFVHAGWIVAFRIRPDLWPMWMVALCALAALVYLLARAHEYLLTQLQPVAKKTTDAGQRPAGPSTHDEQVFSAALERSGHDRLTVLGSEPIGDAAKPIGMRFRVREPSKASRGKG